MENAPIRIINTECKNRVSRGKNTANDSKNCAENSSNTIYNTQNAGAQYAETQKGIIRANKNGKYRYNINFTGNITSAPEAKILSDDEIKDLKPSKFRQILDTRDDIEDNIKSAIDTPEKLVFYDRLTEVLSGTDEDRKNEIIGLFINEYTDKTSEAFKIIPELLSAGYEPKMISRLPIGDYNAAYVKSILKNRDLTEKTNNNIDINQILRGVDENNIQYLNENIFESNGKIPLQYHKTESLEIYNTYLKRITSKPVLERAFDRIHRRNHTVQSIAQIVKDGPIDDYTERLLEYKNYKKFKNVGLKEFHLLSTDKKKEFLNAFISTIDPLEILYEKKFTENFDKLTSRMKIYSEIYSDEPQKIIENCSNAIRAMLNDIPDDERMPLQDKIEYGTFMKQYRKDNPIPAMVYDISKFDTDTETFNGKIYRVVTIPEDIDIGIAMHRIPTGESVLNIEALEITDPNEVLCIGLKGGKNQLNFSKDGYALMVKPRQPSDWWIQSEGDIDSGTGALKNIYKIDKFCLRYTSPQRSITYVPELLKKELDLSQREYTERMQPIKDCRSIDEIEKIDPEFALGINNVLKKNRFYEGIMRPEIIGVCIDSKKPLSEVCPDILNYCERRDIPLIRIKAKEENKDTNNTERTFTIEID